MRSVLLRAGATALTLFTVLVSASYVTSHLKNITAPLKPAVKSSTVTPVTSTYAS